MLHLWTAVVLMSTVFLYLVHLKNLRRSDAQITSRQQEVSAPTFLFPTDVKGINTGHSEVAERGESGYNRFVLGLNYWEQFNMATANFFKLVCLASQWSAKAVRPLTYNSRLYGLTHFKPDDNVHVRSPAISLDVIYDCKKLNSVLNRHGLPHLATLDDFLALSTRGLIVLHFIPEKLAHELPVFMEEAPFKESNIVDCGLQLKEYSAALLTALSAENAQGPPFYIDKYFCVNMSHITTAESLAADIGITGTSNLSVIVFNWRGTSDKVFVHSSARGHHLNNRIMMANVCSDEVFLTYENLITHSDAVTIATKQFLERLNLNDYLAVHFRSEKLGIREPRFPGSTMKCFRETINVYNSILRTHSPRPSSLFLYDFGPYSSDTCKNCKGGNAMKRLFKQEGIEAVHFDPLLVGAINDSGFVAAVEMNMLASAKYLVLCGGGAFQNQAAMRFLKNSAEMGKQRLFQVCVDDTGTRKTMKN